MSIKEIYGLKRFFGLYAMALISIKEKFKINFLPSVHGGVVKLPMYLLKK